MNTLIHFKPYVGVPFGLTAGEVVSYAIVPDPGITFSIVLRRCSDSVNWIDVLTVTGTVAPTTFTAPASGTYRWDCDAIAGGKVYVTPGAA